MSMIEPSLRFSEVAAAALVTPKSLRNWLQRYPVELYSVTPEGRDWRRFCLADLAVISLARHLLPFTGAVETASAAARTILRHMQGEDWLHASPSGFLSFWMVHRYVVLLPSGGPGDSPPTRAQWTISIPEPGRPPLVDAPAYLTIVPYAVLSPAFERAGAIPASSRPTRPGPVRSAEG